ncbi:MAG: hypothetical protein QOD26_3496 [Betaproteobacteria bacterium]|jgi:GNAT superfamily N-acetyltransferase|nr:hypothetical protein [Betaproteobacteria bacterium]
MTLSLLRIARRLTGYEKYLGFVLPAGKVPVSPATAAEIRQVALEELTKYRGDPAYDLSERFLDSPAVREHICIGAFADGSLVAYSFHSRVPTDIDSSLRFQFPAGWIYHFKALTLPQWRGRRLHAALVSAAAALFAREPGFQGLVTFVVSTNLPSLLSFARIGFQPAMRFSVIGKGAARGVLRQVRPAGGHGDRLAGDCRIVAT